MKINYLVYRLQTTGGHRASYDILNRLSENHDVTIVVPFGYIYPAYDHRSWFNPLKIAEIFGGSILHRLRGETNSQVSWMDVEPRINIIPHLYRQFPSSLNRYVPDADVTIAHGWKSAKVLPHLSESKGEKYYFMQHYDIYPIWSDPECWARARSIDDGKCPSLTMATMVPEDDGLRHFKNNVDSSLVDAPNIIHTSDWEAEILSELNLSSEGSVKYGVDTDLFFPSGVTTESVEILSLYRGSPDKGDRDVIEAFNELATMHPEASFTMFGLKKSKEIPSFVEFHADPEQERIRELYSKADIFVYPSWVEGFGMPPMEAMACETAIVSTNVGAVPEYTPEGGVRYIPLQSPSAIVSEVDDLITDESTREDMAVMNYDYIQRFTWDECAEQFEQIITDNPSQ